MRTFDATTRQQESTPPRRNFVQGSCQSRRLARAFDNRNLPPKLCCIPSCCNSARSFSCCHIRKHTHQHVCEKRSYPVSAATTTSFRKCDCDYDTSKVCTIIYHRAVEAINRKRFRCSHRRWPRGYVDFNETHAQRINHLCAKRSFAAQRRAARIYLGFSFYSQPRKRAFIVIESSYAAQSAAKFVLVAA